MIFTILFHWDMHCPAAVRILMHLREITDWQRDVYKRQIYDNIYKNNWRELGKSFGSGGYYRNDWFDRFMEDFKGDNVITGTVTCEGKPMPFVEIYVQEAKEGFSFYASGENYVAITDVNGEFKTLGLKDGLYSVGIGVDGSVLANKAFQGSTCLLYTSRCV